MQQQLHLTQTTANLERLSERLLHLISFVPEEKLTWMPSSTARSALSITAHCALISRFFTNVITDSLPESLPSPEEFFQGVNEASQQVTTREAAITLVKETTAELASAITSVTAETMDTARRSPFGPIPTEFWISQGPDHLAGHIGQVEYLQTIWGDLDNHLN